MLYNSFLYTNNIQKYYSISRCVISISIVIAPTYYFLNKGMVASLLDPKDRDRVEMVLKYIEDSDLHRWSLPDIRAFNIGIDQWRSKLNCITNPYMYEQVWQF